MPRWIFWAGVVASAILALVALGWGISALWHPRIDLPGSEAWLEERGAAFGTAALVLTLPLAALLLRMAARLASRRLFDAVVTIFAVTGASIMMLGTAVLLTMGGGGDGSSSLPAAGLALSTVFVTLSVLSLKSYFEVQSSRTLSFLVMTPLPLALFFVGLLLWSGGSIASAQGLFSALALASAAAFAGIAIHAARHRQMFMEPSGFRRLLVTDRSSGRDEDGDPMPLSREPLANG